MEEVIEEVNAPKPKTPRDWHRYWQREKTAAEERLRIFRKEGNATQRRFLGEKANAANTGPAPTTGSRFNVFHKTITTQENMLYGNTPKVNVSREHQDPDDDEARVAAYLYQRILEAGCRESGARKQALQDRLLPGIGLCRVRYEFDTTTVTGIDGTQQKVITREDAPVEYVHWQDFLWGWARTWEAMPWLGFRVWMDKDEATTRFGEKIAEQLEYKAQLPSGPPGEDESTEDDQKAHIQKAKVYEFWHKIEGKVFWFSEGVDRILDVKDDPLKLRDFWPMPRPLVANLTTSMYIPKADFIINQDLYNEIDILQTRISIITEAIKVVGVYDSSADASVGRMLKEGNENELIPVDSWAMFAEKGGLQGTIDWFPVDTVVGVLDTLNSIQQRKIEQLYEVTGLSDLLRGGNTDQYTGVGTSQLKAKFGSIDIQALQDEIARFVSDLESLRAEIIGKHFTVESIIKQANAEYIPAADKHLLGPALQLMKQPGAQWRIDIRPESIAMTDFAQLQNERISYLTAMATYLQSAQAMLDKVPQSMPILLEFMKFGLAGFKGADYMEGMLDQAIEQAQKAPPPGQDDGKAQEGQVKLQIEQMKLQGQQMKQQGELQKIQAKSQADMQAQQAKLAGEIQKIQVDLQADMTLEERQAKNRQVEIMMETQNTLREISANLQADLAVEGAQATYDITSQEVEHTNNMTEISANAKVGAADQ